MQDRKRIDQAIKYGILDTLIVIALCIGFFVFGLKLSDHYHDQAARDTKDALERQFLRLRAKADADDPCKPYMAFGSQPVFREVVGPISPAPNNGFDTDSDPQPISESFMKDLKENGQAKTSFRKSDLTRANRQ